ncbi:hypothetical protein EAJ10_05040 [Bacteroides thetaiotaomicron]|nr:hypothetical protein EAJ10_05040 [Bacteroides thetaiotaomicron]
MKNLLFIHSKYPIIKDISLCERNGEWIVCKMYIACKREKARKRLAPSTEKVYFCKVPASHFK